MNKPLIVRLYKIGFGDCIHLIVPNHEDKEFHILIDCGTLDPVAITRPGIEAIIGELPISPNGKKHLDLLVVTHPHEDHDKGFTTGAFDDLQIDRIWLSPAFAPDSIGKKQFQMQGYFALRSFRNNAVSSTASNFQINEGNILDELADRFSLSKKETMEILTDKLPKLSGISPEYVTVDTKPAKPMDFNDQNITLDILGPEKDIDDLYTGNTSFFTEQNPEKTPLNNPTEKNTGKSGIAGDGKYPTNISVQDFQTLCQSVQPDIYSISKISSVVENNLSVIVLLTWYGRRLLFCGDAEYSNTKDLKLHKGTCSGSWNVMWARQGNKLNAALDFYKVGHHGSENATPWKKPDPASGKQSPINAILDAILPYPAEDKSRQAIAVVSTQRKQFASIPDPDLMMDLGKRVKNFTTDYIEKATEKITADQLVPPNTAQPQRTDLDADMLPYIETLFTIKPGYTPR